jgi:DNA polymerase-3 subunit delta'
MSTAAQDDSPPPPDWRIAAAAPWLAPARAQWLGALQGSRLPHALLLHGVAGLGKGALAEWIARATLCERPASAPCGECASCTLHEAGSHPDLRRVYVATGKKQIAIDDVRELIGALALKSYRGGRKVGIVDPADAMNVNGANALLKTLEEPSPGTLLILVVARGDRLPATIASRCQRLRIGPPPPEAAAAWLAGRHPGVDWAGPLALAGGAPLAALRLVEGGGAELEREMAEWPAILSRPDADLVGLAERAAKSLPAERLRWIENWITERIRRGLTASAADHSPGNAGLPAAARTRHIQALYALLDDVRAAQSALRGSASVPLLFERVLVALAEALGQLRAARAR